MDIFDYFRREHDNMRCVLDQIHQTAPQASLVRKHLFDKLRCTFTLHIQAEESTIYPELKKNLDFKEEMAKAYEAHRVMQWLFNEIERVSIHEPQWAARMEILREIMEMHLDEEEHITFDNARDTSMADTFSKIPWQSESGMPEC